MRNFPHQVNRIDKVKAALQVVSQLVAEGRDVGDDAILGYAAARAGVYTFRGLDGSPPEQVENAIRREQRKSPSDQGPRTFARDLRRTLILLGFLEHRDTSGWRLSDTGQMLLTLPDPPHRDSTDVWIDALVNLSLSDASGGTVTHPAMNMLRMVANRGSLEKRWLAFALDMGDDSDRELKRVVALQSMGFGAALESVGASEYTAANGVKILPALLQQIGLLSIRGGTCTLTPLGRTLVRLAARAAPGLPTVLRRARRGHSVAKAADVPQLPGVTGQTRTTEEQLHAAAVLEERTNQHQALVRRVVDILKSSGQVSEIRVSEDAFDILATGKARPEVLLIEAKTLRDDSLVQARIALGQLLFYEFFDVTPVVEGRSVRKLVAFDREPGKQATEFLGAYGVACLVAGQTAIQVPAGFEEYFGRVS